MNFPGFTAHASLYRSSGHYRTFGDMGHSDGFAHPARIRDTYFDPSILIRDTYLDPSIPLKVRKPIVTTLEPRRRWKVQDCQLVWEGGTTGQTERRCHTAQYLRTASPLSDCPGADKSGALCYPFCAPGFHGAGPYCWQDCPDGYADDGATCRLSGNIYAKPSYGRGVGTIPWPSCNSNQDYDAGLCYTKCQEGYHGVGPVCWGTCKPGYIDDGATCRPNIFLKQSYWRGSGWSMSCRNGEEQLGALCYGKCPAGYVASGVYCNATTQTCEDVPVTTPPDYSKLTRFCFARHNPDSPWIEPCAPVYTWADTEEHAKQVLRCQCTNCTFDRVECSVLDADMACR